MRFFYKRNRFHQLKGFCTVIQEGSIAKASDVMHVSPSSITLQIQSLERDIGIQLFNRVKQRLVPTEEGYAVYRLALQHIEGIDHIYEKTKDLLQEKVTKSIKIAGHPYALSHLIPKTLKQMIQKHGIKFKCNVFSVSREEALDLLQKRTIDVAVYPVDKEYKDIVIHDVFNTKCKPVLAINKLHPLAKVEDAKITWQLLKKHNVAHIGRSVTMQGLKFALQRYKIDSSVDITHNGTWEMGKALIKENMIVGFFESGYLTKEDKKENVAKDISHLLPDYSFQALHHKDVNSSTVAEFISTIQTHLQ